jgi:hypothetical protein
MNAVGAAVQHIEWLYIRIELFPLPAPVGANLLLSRGTPAFPMPWATLRSRCAQCAPGLPYPALEINS